MKIFSRLFLMALISLTAFTACDDNEPVAPVIPDSISVTPAESTVSSKGGEVKITVTSSGEWTLESTENAYVTPSATKGKDGDEVVFTVKANDQYEDQVFTYDFKCGSETTKFSLTLTRRANDELSLTFADGANNVTSMGGEVKVTVVSNDSWTLEGTSDFVSASKTSGQDGDEVVFTVKPNTETKARTADYKFVNGKKEVAFQISQEAYTEAIEIVGSKELRLSFVENKRFAVELKSMTNNREIQAAVETEGTWIKYLMTRGEEGDSRTAYFEIQKNTTNASRKADITFTNGKGGEAKMTISQLPESKITLEETVFFTDGKAKTDFPINVTSNVEFNTEIDAEGAKWLTFNNFAENTLHFAVAELGAETESRTATVTLVEKNPADNTEPVKVTLTITQKSSSLINCVADMRKARMFFKSLANPEPLQNLRRSTYEALVYIKDKKDAGSLSTIMGVEGKFVIRMGDTSLPWNQLQIVTTDQFNTFTSPMLQLEKLNTWYHIAVTFASGDIQVYINGELKYEKTGYGNPPELAVPNAGDGNEPDWNRAFWIGYSYSSDRYFPGYISEVRVWNTKLNAEQLNAKDHFYKVDPKSEGLVGYWKLDDGQGSVIKDYSVNGNHMSGQINVQNHGQMHYGEEGANWVKTMVP